MAYGYLHKYGGEYYNLIITLSDTRFGKLAQMNICDEVVLRSYLERILPDFGDNYCNIWN